MRYRLGLVVRLQVDRGRTGLVISAGVIVVVQTYSVLYYTFGVESSPYPEGTLGDLIVFLSATEWHLNFPGKIYSDLVRHPAQP